MSWCWYLPSSRLPLPLLGTPYQPWLCSAPCWVPPFAASVALRLDARRDSRDLARRWDERRLDLASEFLTYAHSYAFDLMQSNKAYTHPDDRYNQLYEKGTRLEFLLDGDLRDELYPLLRTAQDYSNDAATPPEQRMKTTGINLDLQLRDQTNKLRELLRAVFGFKVEYERFRGSSPGKRRG